MRLSDVMTLTEKYRADLLKLVDLYKVFSGRSDGSISAAAFATDYAFVTRLRNGNNVTLHKASKLEDYLENKLDDIRRQLAPGASSLHSSQEVFPIPEAEGEHPSSGGSEEGRTLSEEDRARDWARGGHWWDTI
jgi:hypothetical protein